MPSTERLEAQAATKNAIAQLPPELQEVAGRMEDPVFHSACTAGELDLVRGLLDAGLAPDMYPCTEDEDDEPPLTWIAKFRDQSEPRALEVAQLLIDRGAGVDEGLLPLAAAVIENDLPLVRLLLDAGADADLALDELDNAQQLILEQLVANGLSTRPQPSGYFIAFNEEDQNILAVGESSDEARDSAAAVLKAENYDPGITVGTMPASERLVARFLSGEMLSWVGGDVADLEDEESED
jgi:hypothetical protein